MSTYTPPKVNSPIRKNAQNRSKSRGKETTLFPNIYTAHIIAKRFPVGNTRKLW